MNVNMNLTGGGTGVKVAAVEGGAGQPSASMITPGLTPPGGAMAFGMTGSLFKNIESYPGQVLYTPPKMSARQEGKIARRDAVRAARHAERTSEHIRGGIDRKTDMVVGASLRVHAQPDWDSLGLNDGEDGWKSKKPFAQACQREFANWANDARLLQDGEGHYNFGGMMWQAFRNLTGPDAECAGIIHYDEERRAKFNGRWATYVTIIDPDRIETPPSEVGKELVANGYEVFEGVRIEPGRGMTGFWVANRHPSEGMTTIEATQHTFVPRETDWGRAMGFHFFVKTRGGQQRGVTNLTTILRATGQIDTFDDAIIGGAIVAAVLSNYIETMASADTVAEQLAPGANGRSAWDYKLDYYDKAKIRIGGVRIPTMPPGDKIMSQAAARAFGDPTSFRNNFLRPMASSLGISFEQLSGNYSDANYSAARAALLDIWRGIVSIRRMFTAHVPTLIYAAVIEEAIYRGRITLPPGAPPFQENRQAYTACMWTGPGMGWIDPQKEANAAKIMLELKLKSRQTAAAEMDGSDYLETFDQIEQEIFEAEERDFTLDPLAPGTPGADAASQGADEGETTTKKRKAAGAKDGDGDGVVEEE